MRSRTLEIAGTNSPIIVCTPSSIVWRLIEHPWHPPPIVKYAVPSVSCPAKVTKPPCAASAPSPRPEAADDGHGREREEDAEDTGRLRSERDDAGRRDQRQRGEQGRDLDPPPRHPAGAVEIAPASDTPASTATAARAALVLHWLRLP